MKNHLLGIVLALAFVASAGAEQAAPAHHEHAAGSGVQSLDVYADGPHLHLLTGELGYGKKASLLYRRSEDGGVTWSEARRVDAGMPAAFSLHRGMDAQLAAAGDHLVAVWTTAGTDQWGSGPMATAWFADGGGTWRGGPNPADDGSTTGHGFIDIAADPSGASHLTWLDSRDGKQGVRYARSVDGGRHWSANATAKAGCCECCANAIGIGADGEAAILFRDGNPRDMKLARSTGQGKEWPTPIPAGGFDWEFDGCPHVGGGLAIEPRGAIHTLVWTGKAGRAGIYHFAVPTEGRVPDPKPLGDETASHPDLACRANGQLAAVWDSQHGGASGIWGAVSADAGMTWSEPRRLSAAEASASHPRVVAAGGSFRVFWTEARSDKAVEWASAVLP